MSGTLFLCATPIGNLKDITTRVLNTLEEADFIAAEDTRNTLHLLNHYGIKKKMISYHEHNKYEKAEDLIALLREGKNIALVTDAGTPAISDPGEVMVQRCMEEGIAVTSLPGACALITALTLSGKSARRFCFEGFLPTAKKERKRILTSLAEEERTVILYEAPHHLLSTLKDLYEALGDRELTICRELTKIHEEAVPTTLKEACLFYEEEKARGEYVLVLRGVDPNEKEEEKAKAYREMDIREHVALYEEEGYDRKEAMKRVAKDRGISRREVYESLL